MPKFYIEGCGQKKVLMAEDFKQAATDFMTWILFNHGTTSITPILSINEKGFDDDLRMIGDQEAIDDGRIMITYLPLRWGGHYLIAEEVKNALIEQCDMAPSLFEKWDKE